MALNTIVSVDTAAVARRVLQVEAEALMALSTDLPADLPAAVQLILDRTGRVIVSGMGKSGHIGRKIAATLASTGTPSFFVHPAEASHGDLGMVTPQDTCILISNSGETSELGDIIAHCVRFSIPIVGISKRDDSSLMRTATCKLTLPDLPEACSIGMAPTTSTTLTLALGDALAVALMEARAFKPEHFRTYHPGGKLGARLAKAAQLMHGADSLPLVSTTQPMTEVILTMTSRGFGVAGVVDAAGALTGVITDGDLRRNMDGLMGRTAQTVATRNPITVRPETLAAEALAVMNAHKITALFVTDVTGTPLGILHLHDCLRAGVV
ncbi:KpsF/GutQ family sugar-phosphate isomerase [Pararhodobacter zhoushanensis]|uniref:KpsF/GutQ family sugar-phosphate isomerase n=1 Tax=Pararhodobacter zhoushanensis TaxID=2479545 RepID=A0ABT3H2A5_9RHOB|nr:KpsF/GutQ family sugar-phosphate isomerase [Pararhodobacter zhoushanensis]MCW1404339.1 KpsF/GutQ family sugar-phosphate isomerase [Novosphingobium sp. MW5]MCW1933934.1 KpsF/GutQ family sugar-phosphate isomerase [Pararhodobacter zhoushanensis]